MCRQVNSLYRSCGCFVTEIFHCPEYYDNKSKRREKGSSYLKEISESRTVTKLCYIKDNAWDTKDHLCGKCVADVVRAKAQIIQGQKGPRIEFTRLEVALPVAESNVEEGVPFHYPQTSKQMIISPIEKPTPSSGNKNPQKPLLQIANENRAPSRHNADHRAEKREARKAARFRNSEALNKLDGKTSSREKPMDESTRYMWVTRLGDEDADIIQAEGGLEAVREAEEAYRRRRRELNSSYDVEVNKATTPLPGYLGQKITS